MREHKGNNIVALPDSFVVLDVETTGLDASCSIIEVGAICYDRGDCARFCSLIQPYHWPWMPEGVFIDPYITALTGITNEMLQDAPTEDAVIPDLLAFIGNDVIIGHNVNFDVNFVYDAAERLGLHFKNDFIDTLRISRKQLPELDHHRLQDIAAALNVPQSAAHRSMEDCETTLACYLELQRRILAEMSEEAFISLFDRRGRGGKSRVDAFLAGADLPELIEVDDSPIFGKIVVFTGALERLPRADAMALVARLGGIPSDSLTRKTNVLVIGNRDFSSSVKNGKSNKMKKAEELAAKGADIIILSENSFFDMIEEA